MNNFINFLIFMVTSFIVFDGATKLIDYFLRKIKLAEKMFNRIGFVKINECDESIYYEFKCFDGSRAAIIFDLDNFCYEIYNTEIDVHIHGAITRQLYELGWIQ